MIFNYYCSKSVSDVLEREQEFLTSNAWFLDYFHNEFQSKFDKVVTASKNYCEEMEKVENFVTESTWKLSVAISAIVVVSIIIRITNVPTQTKYKWLGKFVEIIKTVLYICGYIVLGYVILVITFPYIKMGLEALLPYFVSFGISVTIFLFIAVYIIKSIENRVRNFRNRYDGININIFS